MRHSRKKYISLLAITILAVIASSAASLMRPTTNGIASLRPKKATVGQQVKDNPDDMPYPLNDKKGIPAIDDEAQKSPIDLKDPDNEEYSAVYDAESGNVTIYRKIGGMNVRLPYSMSLKDYQNDQVRRSMMNYWLDKQHNNDNRQTAGSNEEESSEGNSLLNSKWKIKSDLFTSVFGSDRITMKLQGQAKVSIGVQYNKINNPTMQERMRKTTSFDFNQSVQMNLNSQIGEKMKLAINYNTEATFDFENQVKLDYTGTEDDIIQNIEAGNITWTLPGTLIQGSQSLFGFKTDMKFGKLTVSTVFSQKKGESSSVSFQGGATQTEYEIDVTDYERNKHFFLSHRFKELYDNSLKELPIINSPITINKVEVWVTNTTGNYTDARNVVAFVDMAETGDNISAQSLWHGTAGEFPSNDANNLYESITTNYNSARSISDVTATFSNLSGMRAGRDYEKVESARKLTSSEYTLNEKLGYISLNTALNNNEVLAVAYQYTYRGKVYTVGEFSNTGVDAPNCLYLKLLKGTSLTPSSKNWSLMMKNIYSLGSYNIESKNFELNVVYYNDSTSTYINYFNEGRKPAEGGLNGKTYLEILNCDRLNSNNDVSADGKYDFVSGYTIDPAKGKIIFPTREPFGSHIANRLAKEPELAKKFAFDALYDSTQVYAKQQSHKNKFKIRGSYQSESSNEITLNAFNLAPGSVTVTAGGQVLTENVDYTVDYSLGRVRILNQGILNSGTAINVSYENQSAITTLTQTLLGAHLNYEFNKDFNVGATVIHMKERPLTNKVAFGDEAVSNTMLGINTEYKKELPFITKGLDALPFVSTKAQSSITVEAEMAKLIAGHTKSINAAYIDDFEGSSVPFDIKAWTAWKLASKPQGQPELFGDTEKLNDLGTGFDRAHLAWYTIDPLFLRNITTTPKHIKNDSEQQSNHYVREVYDEELYPNKESAYGESTNISVLNLAYYPKERGSYNFTTKLTQDGFLQNPENNWAGIQRALDITDFENSNIEYIEFWLLDPFIYNPTSTTAGGDLYFNVGSISEDVLRDSRKSFENGLPVAGEDNHTDSTTWGLVSTTTSIIKGFNTDPASMKSQDVGLNGMASDAEREYYTDYIEQIKQMRSSGELSETAYNAIINDPAADDYHYYRGGDYDDAKVSILDRYKKINNTEGNSCPSEYSPEAYSTAVITRPDNEDLNGDYTLNETESYYQYKISLRPDSMIVGHNYITDMMQTSVKLKNGNTEQVKWYQFKIPINAPDKVVGNISDMSSMQFMRMFLTNFTDTCILRFATLELVKGEWRKYTQNLWERNSNPVSQTQFTTSTVNIEENDRRTPINYVLPPGIDRTIDPSNPQLRQLNEQAYSLKVIDLGNADARAVYKNLNMDIRNYKRLKMYIHAEAVDGYPLEDNQMSAFIRIGSDYEDNFYEYEIPLRLTPHGTYSDNSESDQYMVWPEENEVNIPLELFTKAKLARNEARRAAGSNITLQDIYSISDPDKINNNVRIKGNPSLGNVVTMMIGLRARGAGLKSAEIWVNELRLTDFDESGGWAARGRATLKLADIGSISASGQYSSVGFGSIDQSVHERSIEANKQFDVSTNLELSKFIGPDSRLSIPFYAGYSRKVETPKYSPYDTDVRLKTVLDDAENKSEKDSLKDLSLTTETTRSLNLSNVRIKPAKGKKVQIYSPSNLSASYSYTETKITNPATQYDLSKNVNGTIGYSYSTSAKAIEPLKNLKLKSKAFDLIKDFNFYLTPTLISYRWELARDYQETQKRNVTNPDYKVPVSVSKDFNWNRYFDLKYNLSRGLRLSINATTNARIDEPEGAVNKDLYHDEYYHWRDSVWSNITKFGRVTNYQHTGDLSYTVPINKLPYLDFLSATAQYKGTYIWQAGALNTEYEWGNIIQNQNTKQINGMANLSTIYNKSDYLKDIYNKYNYSSSNRNQKKSTTASQTVRYTQNNLQLTAGEPVRIKHNLKTADITARAYDESGRGVKGSVKAIDANTAEFTPQTNAAKGRVIITGTITEETSPAKVVRDVFMIALTSFKNLSVNYSENNSTRLPGYLPGSHFAGTDKFNGSRAPGFGFIAGFQDRDFALKAVEKGWLTTDTTLLEPYTMTRSKSLQVRASFEMFKALKVELTASHNHDNRMTEYYVFDAAGFNGVYNTVETGSMSMTYNMFGTAFKAVKKTGALQSEVYDDFLAARSRISQRMGQTRDGHSFPTTGAYAGFAPKGTRYDASASASDGTTDGYGLTSQDVLIPAFLSAYSGKKADKIFLDFIPGAKHMRPNWKVTFSGLNNIKALKDIARNIEISHSYTSKYSVGSYETNLEWVRSGDGMSYIRDAQDNFIPQYQANTISLSDQLNPLIQISATMINNLTASIGSNRSRTISLNLANNQITENYSRDWTLSLGYRFDKLKLFSSKDDKQSGNNDLNLTLGISQRDNFTILRHIEERNNELASGTKTTSVKFSADYAFSQKFSMQFYYDQSLAKPYISSSYPTNNINVGISLQLSLSE
ncbi:MAG: cell surface protein SprA [Bacteroidales bacterium]|nr:cell surface protein SprA [Bacteroidales bacterium]